MAEQIVAIVDPQVGGDHRSAGASSRLMVVPILGSHSHQGVNKSDVALRDDTVFVRPILMKGVRHALELLAPDAPVVKTDYAGYAAHRRNA
jgi:hypothetical protein